ncbi:MAG: hypothetical protein E5Y10_22715 [Mesorhizobium sp.]|uniref:hypothetical protein n=1 Tax=Mesorhizobium sp. TaxID=1871066 RepID=UPI0011FBD56A|nr:hypothetical protein [Mesorhizobium sp.]TIN41358.1 MAG: hypothetical protein E5Y13_05570 [Mesorhizobium sp.]TJU86136.1 MAG: hypothetical protein E5Y10_22715 [Mesorhizobium sp.]
MDYMSDDFAEALDLIVEGRCREAYEKFRDVYPSLPSWQARTSLITARKVPQAQPFPTEADIDARHDRAIASFKPAKHRHGMVMEYPE